jgi:hypothetical protein
MQDLSTNHGTRIRNAEDRRSKAISAADKLWQQEELAAHKAFVAAEQAFVGSRDAARAKRTEAVAKALEAYHAETTASSIELAGQMEARIKDVEEMLLEAERKLNGDVLGKAAPKPSSDAPALAAAPTLTPIETSVGLLNAAAEQPTSVA